MGVWSEKSALFAMVGELSFCINDLFGFRSGREGGARQVFLNYRWTTSDLKPVPPSVQTNLLGPRGGVPTHTVAGALSAGPEAA